MMLAVLTALGWEAGEKQERSSERLYVEREKKGTESRAGRKKWGRP